MDDKPDDERPGITRWVQYDMPVFVRVFADADGEDPKIDEVRVAVEDLFSPVTTEVTSSYTTRSSTRSLTTSPRWSSMATCAPRP